MNKLIIIGNGFDLAHGLKTKYSDLIRSFWDFFFSTADELHSNMYKNRMITVTDDQLPIDFSNELLV